MQSKDDLAKKLLELRSDYSAAQILRALALQMRADASVISVPEVVVDLGEPESDEPSENEQWEFFTDMERTLERAAKQCEEFGGV